MRCSSCKENTKEINIHECIDCKANICTKCINKHSTKMNTITGNICECPLCIPNNPSRYRPAIIQK